MSNLAQLVERLKGAVAQHRGSLSTVNWSREMECAVIAHLQSGLTFTEAPYDTTELDSRQHPSVLYRVDVALPFGVHARLKTSDGATLAEV